MKFKVYKIFDRVITKLLCNIAFRKHIVYVDMLTAAKNNHNNTLYTQTWHIAMAMNS